MNADFDVIIIGGGVCGVLAAQRLSKEGFTYKVVERRNSLGGVWSYRANTYSQLQAHAALYQWHADYSLDTFPFQKCPSQTVLDTLRRFARDFGVDKQTEFDTEVLNVRTEASKYQVFCKHLPTGKLSQMTSTAVMICTGILGKQYSLEHRGLPDVQNYKGRHIFAGKEENGRSFLEGDSAKDKVSMSDSLLQTDEDSVLSCDYDIKDVVILGSGAFGLEAMEAAQRCGARSITLVTRPRERWIVPYSQQFKFILISHAPLLPRSAKCYLINSWLTNLYKKCGIEHMVPSSASPQSFTGQCNDAFFLFAKQGKSQYIIDEVQGFDNTCINLKSGKSLDADILVIAVGHEVQHKPAFLDGLCLGYTTDLHNFAFLGKNPLIGVASDWVWFNVPHGPQKQIDSFISALRACRRGQAGEVKAALMPTPFKGCKGESFNPEHLSGMQQRREAYWRTQAAGLSKSRKLLLTCQLFARDWGIWLLCAAMCAYESFALKGWLDVGQ